MMNVTKGLLGNCRSADGLRHDDIYDLDQLVSFIFPDSVHIERLQRHMLKIKKNIKSYHERKNLVEILRLGGFVH